MMTTMLLLLLLMLLDCRVVVVAAVLATRAVRDEAAAWAMRVDARDVQAAPSATLLSGRAPADDEASARLAAMRRRVTTTAAMTMVWRPAALAHVVALALAATAAAAAGAVCERHAPAIGIESDRWRSDRPAVDWRRDVAAASATLRCYRLCFAAV
jgi:hypothetical protein